MRAAGAECDAAGAGRRAGVLRGRAHMRLGRDLQNRILERPGRHADGDGLAPFATDQGMTDGGFVTDTILQRIGFGGSHNRVLDLAPRPNVLQPNGRADRDGVGVAGVVVDHSGAAQHLLDLQNPALDERLIVFGVVIFGVFREVAELLGLLDALGDLFPTGALEVLDLLFELVQTLLRQDGLFLAVGNFRTLVIFHRATGSWAVPISYLSATIDTDRQAYAWRSEA